MSQPTVTVGHEHLPVPSAAVVVHFHAATATNTTPCVTMTRRLVVNVTASVVVIRGARARVAVTGDAALTIAGGVRGQ